MTSLDLFLGLLLVAGLLLLFVAGVVGVTFGIYRARPKSGQPGWNWTPILYISVPSALVVSNMVLLIAIFFVITGG